MNTLCRIGLGFGWAALLMLGAADGAAKAASLTTTFAGGNGSGGNYFDVNVKSNDLTVTGLDLNIKSGTWQVDLYTRPGTWVGNTSTLTGWTLVDSLPSIVGAGSGLATAVNVSDFVLPSNQLTAFRVTVLENGVFAPVGGIRYTNASPVGDIFASNQDLDILTGAGINGAGRLFEERIWNGTINYEVAATPVPTPALLPGLLGMGLATLRKRKLSKLDAT